MQCSSSPGEAYGLLRGTCHRARFSRDPLARNDVSKLLPLNAL
jgi:hypothetical protein